MKAVVQRVSEASVALRRDIAISVRSDPKNIDEARNRGVFISEVAEKSPAVKDMGLMTDFVQAHLSPELAEAAEIKSDHLFQRFRKR